MDHFTDERDYQLLAQDRYTFAVLRRILDGPCDVILTDHERLIICHSRAPYPVWVWCPDDLADSEIERIYMCLCEQGMLEGKHHFNMKYSLASLLIARARLDNRRLVISTNMFAYDCPQVVPPSICADGTLSACTMADIDQLVEFMDLFHRETGVDQKTKEVYRTDASTFVSGGNMYFWRNAQGEAVACCKFTPNRGLASLNLVFTHPTHRRRHYAENMVYQVTRIAAEQGYLPMLYTDADYVASNACYEKLGYVLRGKLCTVMMSLSMS